MPTEEHRRYSRVKLHEIEYVNLDSGNGGIVIDVSREGFGLQLAVPLQEGENTVHFRLPMASVIGGGEDAIGEVAWKDKTKKRIGLRITHLPAGIRRRVETWLRLQPQASLERTAAPAPEPAPEPAPAPTAAFTQMPVPTLPEVLAVVSGGTENEIDSEIETVKSVSNDPADLQTLPVSSEPFLDEPVPSEPIPDEPVKEEPLLNEPVLNEPVLNERANVLSPEQLDLVPRPGESFYGPTETIFPTSEFNQGPADPTDKSIGRADMPLSMFFSTPPLEEYPRSVSSRRPLSYVAFLILALVVCGGVWGYFNKQQVGKLLIGLGENISGKSRTAAIEPSIPPAAPADTNSAPESQPGRRVTADQSSGQVNSARTNNEQAESKDGSSDSISNNPPTVPRRLPRNLRRTVSPSKNSRQINSSGGNGGWTELALARKYLVERPSPGYALEAELLLWSAVKDGNSEAELELADLYLMGNTLRKNCEQARVLLVAASKSKNDEAADRLRNFRSYGCR